VRRQVLDIKDWGHLAGYLSFVVTSVIIAPAPQAQAITGV
jgi:hypothetical protein